MSRLLFAAHDPGGALMVGAAAPELIFRGHEIIFAAAGPAIDLWRRAGHRVTAFEDAVGADFSTFTVDALIAGTGFGGYERAAWKWARGAGVRSLAAIDSWTHLMRRFETPAGRDFPDLVAVIDEGLVAEFSAEAGGGVDVAAVGQPHLETETARLRAARDGHRPAAGQPQLIFFSEPIIEDFGRSVRGFEQYEVFEMAVCGLSAQPLEGVSLVVKPHPREPLERWHDTAVRVAGETGMAIALADRPAEDLLATADGVIGMTTMVLLEAHLAQVPVLSLQPARTRIVNPVIEYATTPVIDPAEVTAAIAAFLGKIGVKPTVNPRLHAVFDDARGRFADVVESRLLY